MIIINGEKYIMTYEELFKKNIEQEQLIKEKNIEIDKLKVTIENQQLHINTLNKLVFGPRSEKAPQDKGIIYVEGTQVSIFGEIKDEEIKEQVEEQTEEITIHRKKKSKKRISGIKKAELKNVTMETREVMLDEDNQNCPECGEHIEKIGKEVVRQEIEFVPAKFVLVNHVRNIYKCTKCGKDESKKDTPTIIKTKTPNALLAHSFASPSLATEVIYQKYYMGVPLYRQEKIWDDRGLILPRNMMANWCIKISEYYLEPIYNLIIKQIKEQNEVLHQDETTIQCNKEIGKNASSKSYMWVTASGELEKKKAVVFHYSQSRSSKEAEKLLEGYKGILVTDGYAGYNSLDEKLTHAECWAHARRYFLESVPLDENRKPVKTSTGYIRCRIYKRTL